jgi:endonuclease YncB( thermonuclease family)
MSLLVLMLALPAAADGYRFPDVVLESIHDGDSFTVSLPGIHPLWGDRAAVRIAGIDAPELRGACESERTLALEARRELWALLSVARRVDLEDVGRDKYGRILARVLADRRDVAEHLIGKGLARPYDGGTKEGWCAP